MMIQKLEQNTKYEFKYLFFKACSLINESPIIYLHRSIFQEAAPPPLPIKELDPPLSIVKS